MAEEKKPAKDRIKAKAKETKAKVKGKVKAGCAVVAAILSLVLFEGCSTATPASRATTASYEFWSPAVSSPPCSTSTRSVADRTG